MEERGGALGDRGVSLIEEKGEVSLLEARWDLSL